MTFYSAEIVTAPSRLPITATDEALAAAVVEEIERGVLWRAIVSQERRILIDGPLPPHFEIEPVTAIVSLTRWTPTDDAAVIAATDYISITRDPSGTIIIPAAGKTWPAPERSIGSFALTYMAGWEVSDTSNSVPASVQLMVERAVAFRKGSGLAGFSIGSLTMKRSAEYASARLPASIISIASSWAYRPGLIVGRA